jgi:hypothetical protein
MIMLAAQANDEVAATLPRKLLSTSKHKRNVRFARKKFCTHNRPSKPRNSDIGVARACESSSTGLLKS